MTRWEQLQQWFDRPGWRRHAPAAGSVLAHVTVVAALVGMMSAVTAENAPRPKPEKRLMSVELVQLPEPAVEAGARQQRLGLVLEHEPENRPRDRVLRLAVKNREVSRSTTASAPRRVP